MPDQMFTTDHEREAYELGVEAAEAAASWVLDGNTSQEDVRGVLAALDDGDPLAYDLLPAMPDLSGEWADGPTPASLCHDVLPAGYFHDPAADAVGDGSMEALADAWEAGVSDTFRVECERLLRAALDDPSPAERLEYLRGELRAERISWGELHELQGLAEHITPDDMELREWAGLPEFEDDGAEG